MTEKARIRCIRHCRHNRQRAWIRAFIAADGRERLPLGITIDPPGATDDEVRRNFEALKSFPYIDPVILAILTDRFRRRFKVCQSGMPRPPVPEEEIQRARERWLQEVAGSA